MKTRVRFITKRDGGDVYPKYGDDLVQSFVPVVGQSFNIEDNRCITRYIVADVCWDFTTHLHLPYDELLCTVLLTARPDAEQPEDFLEKP